MLKTYLLVNTSKKGKQQPKFLYIAIFNLITKQAIQKEQLVIQLCYKD